MLRSVLRFIFYIILIGLIAAVEGLLVWGMLIAAYFFVSLALRLFVDENTIDGIMEFLLSMKGYYVAYTFTFIGLLLRLPKILKQRKLAREAKAKAEEEARELKERLSKYF